MPKPVGPNVKIEYDWCQYTVDTEYGLFTIKKIVTTDIAKVYSQSEAIQLIDSLKIADQEKQRAQK